MHPCRLCTIQCSDGDPICVFCRSRDRFWRALDTLPVRCRGWGIQNLRIWTAIIEEELERVAEAERQQAQAEVSAAPKSGSLAAPEGRPEEKADKTWVKPKEEERSSPGTAKPGLVEVNEPQEEEGKYSSSSRPAKEERKHHLSEGRSSRRSRSRRRRRDSKSRDARRRRRPSTSVERRKPPREEGPVEKERKAKPSVRPPRTPSKSPPKRPKRLPVAKPKPRPAPRYWQGPVRSWKLDPAYYGVNKGAKKRERHYHGDQGGR